jgi:hypothetical protein
LGKLRNRNVLQEEVDRAQNSLGSFCDKSGKPRKISILMIEPATDLSPSDATRCCCDIKVTLLFDPVDKALNFGNVGNTLAIRQQQVAAWGSATPVVIPDENAHHTPQGLQVLITRQYTAPSGQVIKASTFDPVSWIKDEENASDNVFVCHSQGCALLLKTLQLACALSLASD